MFASLHVFSDTLNEVRKFLILQIEESIKSIFLMLTPLTYILVETSKIINKHLLSITYANENDKSYALIENDVEIVDDAIQVDGVVDENIDIEVSSNDGLSSEDDEGEDLENDLEEELNVDDNVFDSNDHNCISSLLIKTTSK